MFYAQVVKLVDTLASGASLRKKVEVQVLSWAPTVLPNRFGCKACHRRLNAGPGLEPKKVRQLAQRVATSGTAAKPPKVVKIAPRLA